MLGRGLVANPNLALTIKQGTGINTENLRAFHNALTRAYADEMPFSALHGHMCEIMSYVACCLENTKKPLKLL